MSYHHRPFRSILYIPGDKQRALDKALTLDCDGIIFDLEDAVGIDSKAGARETLAAQLGSADYGRRAVLVRVNGHGTQWHEDDLKAICAIGPEAILLPKVDSAADVERLAAVLEQYENCADTKIWAMMESPLGILNAQEIAAAPRMAGMVVGSNDLLKDLNATQTPERTALVASLGTCLLAARAFGLVCIDGVYNAFKDEDGLAVECAQGQVMGFDGKSLIHPAQLAVTNEVFSPSDADIDLARRQVAAFEEAEASGKGIAVVDGKIVENLHIVTARKLLAMASVIVAAGS
ncbi:MAG: CoA ester lyase [Rhodobacteraceae bacterium]|nr:CoA ester lyase [Paracoccaceae bacterium]